MYSDRTKENRIKPKHSLKTPNALMISSGTKTETEKEREKTISTSTIRNRVAVMSYQTRQWGRE